MGISRTFANRIDGGGVIFSAPSICKLFAHPNCRTAQMLQRQSRALHPPMSLMSVFGVGLRELSTLPTFHLFRRGIRQRYGPKSLYTLPTAQ